MGAETQAALIAWYVQQMAVLREQVDTAQQQTYADAQGQYTDEALAAYVAAIVPVMAGAQAAAAQLTATYLAYMLADMAGESLASVKVPAVDLSRVTGAAIRNGVAPEVVYRRPFEQIWRDLGQVDQTDFEELLAQRQQAREDQRAADQARQDQAREDLRDLERAQRQRELDQAAIRDELHREAVANGERRARTLGLTDLQLATTNTAREVLQDDSRVWGYRRVLTGAENCGMCIVAATALYHTRNLMPLHPNCDCAVAPIVGTQDPGRFVNNHLIGEDAIPNGTNKNGVPTFAADQTLDIGNLLEDAHNAVAQRFGRSYRDAKGIDYRKVILVREHGETGPTLTIARHKFSKVQIDTKDLSAR